MIISIADLRSEDAPILAELANNYRIRSNLRDAFPRPYTCLHAETFIKMVLSDQPIQKKAIIADGQLAGIIGLELKQDIFRKSAEIG